MFKKECDVYNKLKKNLLLATDTYISLDIDSY